MEKEIVNSIRDCELFTAYQENPAINISSYNVKSCCQAANGGRNKHGKQQQQLDESLL